MAAENNIVLGISPGTNRFILDSCFVGYPMILERRHNSCVSNGQDLHKRGVMSEGNFQCPGNVRETKLTTSPDIAWHAP